MPKQKPIATPAHNYPGFTTAQQWDPSLPHFDLGDRFAPRVRANELAKAAQTQQR